MVKRKRARKATEIIEKQNYEEQQIDDETITISRAKETKSIDNNPIIRRMPNRRKRRTRANVANKSIKMHKACLYRNKLNIVPPPGSYYCRFCRRSFRSVSIPPVCPRCGRH